MILYCISLTSEQHNKLQKPCPIAHPYAEVQSEPVFSGLSRSETDLGMNPLVPNDHSRTPLLESNVDFRAKRARVMSPLCIALTRRPYWFGSE